jgi:hypothetical protein
MFLGLEMPSGICVWRPYLYKILVFVEQAEAERLFLLCFAGVFSRARNVLPSTFLLSKVYEGRRSWNCGGASTCLHSTQMQQMKSLKVDYFQNDTLGDARA